MVLEYAGVRAMPVTVGFCARPGPGTKVSQGINRFPKAAGRICP